MREYHVDKGSNIHQVAKTICDLARKENCAVGAVFNEIRLISTPGQESQEIINSYYDKHQKRYEQNQRKEQAFYAISLDLRIRGGTENPEAKFVAVKNQLLEDLESRANALKMLSFAEFEQIMREKIR